MTRWPNKSDRGRHDVQVSKASCPPDESVRILGSCEVAKPLPYGHGSALLPYQAVGILQFEYSDRHSEGTFGVCTPVMGAEKYLS